MLGSGDRTRVGSFHEASLSVVEHRREESHDAQEAARLQGVRPGMTLPIVHQDVVVGTVGITGTPDQVLRFGQVVKRQTEILLEEAVLVRTRMTRERVLESLLRDLLTHDPDQPADVASPGAGLRPRPAGAAEDPGLRPGGGRRVGLGAHLAAAGAQGGVPAPAGRVRVAVPVTLRRPGAHD